jgi:hypothetical protein
VNRDRPFLITGQPSTACPRMAFLLTHADSHSH